MTGIKRWLQHNHGAQYGTFVYSSIATCWCICKQNLADICHGNWDGLFMKLKEQCMICYFDESVLTLKQSIMCFEKVQNIYEMLFKMIYNHRDFEVCLALLSALCIYASMNTVSVGSDYSLLSVWCQAITWNNTDLGTNFSETWTNIQKFSFMKLHRKMSSAKWRPFCSGKDELNAPKSLLVLIMACWLVTYTVPMHHLNQWSLLNTRVSC